MYICTSDHVIIATPQHSPEGLALGWGALWRISLLVRGQILLTAGGFFMPLYVRSFPPLREAFPALQVIRFVIVGVGLTLEGDLPIDFPPAKSPDEPFRIEQQVEQYIAQFAHLRGVYCFVPDRAVRQWSELLAGEDDAKQIYGPEAAERDEFVVNDLHGRLGLFHNIGLVEILLRSGHSERHDVNALAF